MLGYGYHIEAHCSQQQRASAERTRSRSTPSRLHGRRLSSVFKYGSCSPRWSVKPLPLICGVAAVRFDSFRNHQTCTVRLSVRTQAFHACKTGSIPVPCTRCTASPYAVAGWPLDAGHEASQTATRVLAKGHGTNSRFRSSIGRAPLCHSGGSRIETGRDRQFRSCSLMVKQRAYTP